jgi:hypothetical protein
VARVRATIAAVGGPLPALSRLVVDWGDRSEPTLVPVGQNTAEHWYEVPRTYTIRAQAITRDGNMIGGPGQANFNAAAPFLSQAVPAFGPEEGGNPVILQGGNLGTPTAVVFTPGGLASNVQGVSSTAISCTAPASVAGLASVSAVAPTGTNSVQYEYRAPEEPEP